MAKQTRATLKNFFKAGQLPTADHFGDLVDSSLNLVDEGFGKSPENGVQISTLGNERALLSFYTPVDPNKSQWSIAYGEDTEEGVDVVAPERTRKRLVFGARQAGQCEPVMTLDPQGNVGVGTSAPQCELDVNGVVRSAGRVGAFQPLREEDRNAPRADNSRASVWEKVTGLFRKGKKPQAEAKGYEASPVPADGNWHDITGWLSGCQAFEVMAGTAGRAGQGRYALLHAFALNAFNPARGWLDFLWPKNKIHAHEAYYNNRCDRLELRWDGSHDKDARYRLLIRSRCAYEDGPGIQYSVTRLWFDAGRHGGPGKAR